MTQFDWAAMMRVGLYDLRLHPDQFWGLTPLEFLIISGLEARETAAMTRAVLQELCAQFPDMETE
jgi:uncharacterized phage protein (TIGR02216 family)